MGSTTKKNVAAAILKRGNNPTKRKSVTTAAASTTTKKRKSYTSVSTNNSIHQDPNTVVAREEKDLPEKWPNHPVLLCANTTAAPDLKLNDTTDKENHQDGTTHASVTDGPCPLGKPVSFSTDLFEGQCLVRLRDVPSDDSGDDDASYFDGRKRKFQAIVQGRFKKEGIRLSDVMTGHEFVSPLQHLPPSFVIRAGTTLIKRLALGADVRLDTDQPYALSTLAGTSQVVSIDKPGCEPMISNRDIQENTSSLLGDDYISSNRMGASSLSSKQRKQYLSNPNNASKYVFDTESIYTFDFYQNLLDVKTYSLDLGFTSIGLSKVLDGQPIQIMSKTTDGKYLWNFQLWHESLLSTSPTSSKTTKGKEDDDV